MRRTSLVIAGIALAFTAGCASAATPRAQAPATASQTPTTRTTAQPGTAEPTEGRARPAATTAPNVIGTYGLGPYRLGASAAALVSADKLRPVPRQPCEPSYLARAPYSPTTVEVAVPEARVTMVATTSRHHRTPSGVSVGDTAAQVRSTYGSRLTPVDVPSTPPRVDYLLRVGRSALGFRTEGGRVVEIIAGAAASVEGYLHRGEFHGC